MATMRPVDLYSVEYITLNLRKQDQVELYNMRPYDTPFMLAQEAAFTFRQTDDKARGAIAWYDGKPCALVGFSRSHPQMWNAIAFGTDDWRNVAIDLMRWARRAAQRLVDEGIGEQSSVSTKLRLYRHHPGSEVSGPSGIAQRSQPSSRAASVESFLPSSLLRA